MKLYKRIAIPIFITFILMLASLLAINYLIVNSNLQKDIEAYKNSIKSISYEISKTELKPQNLKDIIENTLLFENFNNLKVLDTKDAVVYEKSLKTLDNRVPTWFMKIFPIEEKSLDIPIISEDKGILGSLIADINRDKYYKLLYEQFLYIIIAFVVFFLLSLISLNVILKDILKALQNIRIQAEDIIQNRFAFQKELPNTIELKEITTIMNSLTKRVKELFERNTKLVKMNEEVSYIDQSTKLFNRKYFNIKLPEYLLASDGRHKGSLVLVRVNGILIANKKLGYQEVDKFFEKFALSLNESCKKINKPVICRLNGTEFAMILPEASIERTKRVIQDIMKETLVLVDRFKMQNIVYFSFALVEYSKNDQVSKLLSYLDNAIAQATLHKEDYIEVFDSKRKSSKLLLSKNEWRMVITSSLKDGYFRPKLAPIYKVSNKEVVANSLICDIQFNSQEIPYADFLPQLVELNLYQEFLMFELDLIKREELQKSIISIEIIAQTLQDSKSLIEFQEKIKSVINNFNGKLFIEISEFDLLSIEPIVLESISKFLKKHGIGLGINRFNGNIGNYSYLNYTSIAYVKMSSSLYFDMDIESRDRLLKFLGKQEIKLLLTGIDLDNLDNMDLRGIEYITKSAI